MYEVSRPGRPRIIRGFQGAVTLDHKVMHAIHLAVQYCVHAVSIEDDETYMEIVVTCASYYAKVSI